jgi:hypothetical protein
MVVICREVFSVRGRGIDKLAMCNGSMMYLMAIICREVGATWYKQNKKRLESVLQQASFYCGNNTLNGSV